MELDFSKIERLKKIRSEKSELSSEENALASPFLEDKRLIREIYRIFVEILSERTCPPNPDSVTQRKKFIFIVIYLFSPSTLAGGRMKHGLREEMSRVMDIRSAGIISKDCEDVVFLFRHYKDFSYDIRNIYAEIMSRLKAKGFVK